MTQAVALDGGSDRAVAILQACQTRFRPVMMTCNAACAGLLPAALSTAIGAQVQRPLALVVVGGILLAPVLVLIVAKFVGPMKRNPQIVYGVCVVLVLIVCLLTVTGSGGNWMPSSISAALAVLVLWWSYTRETRKATPETMNS